MDDAKRKWLKKLLKLMQENPDAHFSYTTSDDGVWLSYGPGRNDEINLGFSNESAAQQLAAWSKT